MREADHFWNALRFLTVILAPGADHVEDDWLMRSAKYFPLVGIIVGCFSAIVLLFAAKIWNGLLPPLLAVAAGIALTGACMRMASPTPPTGSAADGRRAGSPS